MDKSPFSLYDFFGYLSTGFIWLLSIDFLFNRGWLIGQQIDWTTGAFFVVIAYIIGHVNSHLALWLIEKKFINLLGYPSRNLFTEPQKPHKFFKEFRKPLPLNFRNQIISKYSKTTGNNDYGESMFLHCFHTVKERCPKTYNRLQSLINLYGFSRNMSFALFFIGIAITIKVFIVKDWPSIYMGLLSISMSFMLLLRTLKFFRHYSIEVFATFGTMRE